MVHVRMREENEVERGKVGKRRCGFYKTFDTERHGPKTNPDAGAENGIGNEGETVDLQQDGAVPEPSGMQTAIGPVARVGMERGGFGLARIFFRNAAKKGRRGPAQEPSRFGCVLKPVRQALLAMIMALVRLRTHLLSIFADAG